MRKHDHSQCERNLRGYRSEVRCLICNEIADHAPSGLGNPKPLCQLCIDVVEGPDCTKCKNDGEWHGRKCPQCNGVAGKKTEIIITW